MVLFSGFVKAETIDYGVYSDEYNNCLSSNFSEGMDTKSCDIEEYYRIKQALLDIQNKLKAMPVFAEYNHVKELSLFENIPAMEKYNELFCKINASIINDENSISQCQLQQINYLYVDLYKLYEVQATKMRKAK